VGAGAKVVLGARRLDALEEVRASIGAKFGSSDAVVIVQTDVTKREDVRTGACWRPSPRMQMQRVCLTVYCSVF
jgi:NADP-dependent 3-hydroxy acid dehydrogenase YdfG